jgi:hypothetical protein
MAFVSHRLFHLRNLSNLSNSAQSAFAVRRQDKASKASPKSVLAFGRRDHTSRRELIWRSDTLLTLPREPNVTRSSREDPEARNAAGSVP